MHGIGIEVAHGLSYRVLQNVVGRGSQLRRIFFLRRYAIFHRLLANRRAETVGLRKLSATHVEYHLTFEAIYGAPAGPLARHVRIIMLTSIQVHERISEELPRT